MTHVRVFGLLDGIEVTIDDFVQVLGDALGHLVKLHEIKFISVVVSKFGEGD